MEHVKLIQVGKTVSSGKAKPIIKLLGNALSDYGFRFRELVTVTCTADTIALKAIGVGTEVYLNHVADIRKNKQHLLEVDMQTTGINPKLPTHQLCLTLEERVLTRFNYKMGDPLLAVFSQGFISLKKIPPSVLGFDDEMQFKILSVYKRTRNNIDLPFIDCCDDWIQSCGFIGGQYANVTYTDKGLTMSFTPTSHQLERVKNGAYPPQINVTTLKKKNKVCPRLRLAGQWLNDIGYRVGDTLLIGYKSNLIVLKHIDLASLVSLI